MEALKFREMPYERPDGEALKTSMRTLTEKLRAAGSYEAAKAVFLEKETLSKHIQTLATLAQVRHTIDTRDKFYDEENGFLEPALSGAGGVFAGVDEGDARLAVPCGL